MATIYVLDDTFKLKNFFIISNNEQKTPNFLIQNKSSWSNLDLRKLTTFCQGRDVVYTKDEIKLPIHYHNGEEKRLILYGTCTFFIPINQHVHIIECATGDLISINDKLPHWFETDGELLLCRFFGKNDLHTSITDDINQKYLKTYDNLNNSSWKEQLDL